MTLVWGILLGVGIVLIASALFRPRRENRAQRVSRVFAPLALARDRIARAGLGGTSPAIVVAVSLIVAIALGAFTLALVPVVAIAVAAAAVGLALPTLVISWRARSRQRAARIVWPDVVDQLVSAVRSGLALPEAVVTLARSGPVFAREAFGAFESDYRATGNFSDCLDRLKARLADPVADRLLETLRMSREVGGTELTTVLRNLASYLRQDAAIRLEVEARQSWIVNAARLGVAAPWLVLLLLATRPEAAAAYNTAPGTVLILAGAGVSVIAYRLMIGLGRLPEDGRWFA